MTFPFYNSASYDPWLEDKNTSAKAPELALIAAVARNRVIGRQGQMPWHIPCDLAHFRHVTMGHPMVMGRRSFESLGRVLPGRPHLVLTRNRFWQPPPDVIKAQDWQTLLLRAAEFGQKICVIGGGQIFTTSLIWAQKLILTELDVTPIGDCYFPTFESALFPIRASSRWKRCPISGIRYRFVTRIRT